MSRSFGDIRLKEPLELVTACPDVTKEILTPADLFFIVASDGMWDVITNEQAVQLVLQCSSSGAASKMLVEEALKRGSRDNITAIVSFFLWDLEYVI